MQENQMKMDPTGLQKSLWLERSSRTLISFFLCFQFFAKEKKCGPQTFRFMGHSEVGRDNHVRLPQAVCEIKGILTEPHAGMIL